MDSPELVAPDLWRLTALRRGKPSSKTGYVLREGENTILIDPVIAGEAESVLAALDDIVRGRIRILVTTPFHVRDSELLWRRWRDQHQVTILGHRLCASRLDDPSAFQPLEGGETLDGGVRAHSLGQGPSAEIPFEIASHRALAVGDRLLESDGELRFWPPKLSGSERDRSWYEQQFLPAVRGLAQLPIERVLVTHGEPVLSDGADEITASLARAPWSR